MEARLIEIIKAYQNTDSIFQIEPVAINTEADDCKDNSDILLKLENLDKRLAEIEAEWPTQIGHNNPPEAIETEILSQEDIVVARSQTELLEQKLASPQPSEPEIKSATNKLLTFGLKLSIWLGERLTKFIDATLVALAKKLANVLPDLLEILRALSKLIGH